MNKKEPEYQRIRKVKEKHESFLMSIEGVVGCSIGYKEIQGKKTSMLAIVCFVKKKKPRGLLSGEELIPREIEGVPVDIVEVGKIEKFEI